MKVISQQVIKRNNLKKIYRLIASGKEYSRADIAKVTELSKATVSSLVDELILAGYIADEGAVQTTKQGRRPNILKLNNPGNKVAVINWRSEALEAAIVNLSGQVDYYNRIHLQNGCDHIKCLIESFYNILMPNLGGARLLGLCIIVPSMIDTEARKMLSSVLPVKIEDDAIGKIRQGITGVPLSFLNDTACYAFAEKTLSPRTYENFVFVNLNKGIGAVIYADGKMIRGANGMTTQFGHYSVERYGEPCSCGNRGCLERRIGESALINRADEFDLSDEHNLTFERLGKLAAEKDTRALNMLDSFSSDLAYGLGNLITLYNTKNVVIGGKGQNLGELFLEQVSSKIKNTGFGAFVAKVEIRYTSIGDTAQIQGAARYFLDRQYRFFEQVEDEIFLI